MNKFRLNLKNLFSAITTNQENTSPEHTPHVSFTASSEYSASEAERLFSDTYVKNQTHSGLAQNSNLYQSMVTQALDNTHQYLAYDKKKAAEIRKLSPEIVKAEEIWISSIMSPNDLQSGSFFVNIPPEILDSLSKESSRHIISEIESYFNSMYGVDEKIRYWLKDMLFGNGSHPVMVLPIKSLRKLINSSIKEGMEVFTEKHTLYKELWDAKIYSEGKPSSKIGVESLGDDLHTIVKRVKLVDPKSQANKNEIRGVYSKMCDILNQENSIRFIENMEVVGLESIMSQQQEVVANEKVKRWFDSEKPINIKKETHLDFTDILPEGSFITTEELDDASDGSHPHPLMIDLPPESVIPVHVPGSPNQHLGYFILIDENGHPVQVDVDDVDSQDTTGQTLEDAYEAMFGYGNTSGKSRSMKTNANVFEIALDRYLSTKMKDGGFQNIQISRFESVANCMLSRLLRAKKTNVVFVPKELMTYMCFDYRDDGTGKSMLDDIEFVLSLRISLFVAGIMSQLNDAIDHKEVTVQLDPKTADPLKLLTELRSDIVNKKQLMFTTDPRQISSSIAEQSITITPEGIPGLSGYSVKTDSSPRSSARADSELLDTLDDMYGTGLQIPHSALNQLSEDEFSRSIATTNLLFAQVCRAKQRTVCDFCSRLLRTCMLYDKSLQATLLSKIKEGLMHSAGDQVNPEELLKNLVEQVTLDLPKPTLAPDRAQYEALEEYIGIIETLTTQVIPDDLASSMENGDQVVSMIRAFISRDMVNNYLTMAGIRGIDNVPDISDFDGKKLSDMQLTLTNIIAELSDIRRIEDKSMPDVTEEESGDNSGGGRRW